MNVMIRRITIFALYFLVSGSLWSTFSQEKPQPTPVAVTIEPVTFDPYVGRYENATDLPGLVF